MVEEECVVRPGDPCSCCASPTGPRDCPLAYLVLTDDGLSAALRRIVQAQRAPSREHR